MVPPFNQSRINWGHRSCMVLQDSAMNFLPLKVQDSSSHIMLPKKNPPRSSFHSVSFQVWNCCGAVFQYQLTKRTFCPHAGEAPALGLRREAPKEKIEGGYGSYCSGKEYLLGTFGYFHGRIMSHCPLKSDKLHHQMGRTEVDYNFWASI